MGHEEPEAKWPGLIILRLADAQRYLKGQTKGGKWVSIQVLNPSNW